MHDKPPSEAIRHAVGIHFKMLSRQTRRDYAGFDVGKRRKLSIVPFIAREMAKRILQQVILEDAGEACRSRHGGKAHRGCVAGLPRS